MKKTSIVLISIPFLLVSCERNSSQNDMSDQNIQSTNTFIPFPDDGNILVPSECEE